MKRRLPLVVFTASVFMVQPLIANEQFNQGMQQGKANKDQGAAAIQGFKPADVIPGYTTSPSESGYYGGVTSSGVDMTAPGSAALNSSAAGKSITQSILNTPADIKPSLDNPFVAEGLELQAKAETITGGGFEGCVDQPASFTEITIHQCLRDTKIEQSCVRTATLGYEGSTRWETEEVVYQLNDLPVREENGNLVVSVTPQISGEIIAAYYSYPKSRMPGANRTMTISVLGNNISWVSTSSASNVSFTPSRGSLTAGVAFESRHPRKIRDGSWVLTFTRHTRLELRFVLRVKKAVYVPKVTWSEHCPFSKTEGAMTSSQCVEPGETRHIVVEGQTLSLSLDCWKWQDTWLTQAETEGTCGEYMKDNACSVTRSQCVDLVDGFCVSQQVTYSCERKKTGSGKICGGEFFCTDGSCAQGQTGTSNMFGQAVSALAAVASAGKDVAALNGENVRAFTGKAKSCKKMAVGFNNCCKDSGWGQDVGLASCSSDEKALGKAKEKKLTVYVGEYCSNKVLGVCLEKKRGYCQFDSKLARIVQEQGRRDQLGVGFGSGKSPDCRGITVDELQKLDFGAMNFSDFYSDLHDGSDIPEDQSLLKKAKDIIEKKMKEKAP